MPRVPGYQQRVNPTPIPGVQQSDQSAPGISADALGAGHAQALQNTGSELTKIGVEIEQRANTLAAKQAYDAASQEMRDLLHNPDTGIFSTRGNGAKGAAGTTQKALQKIKEKHTKGLSGRAVEQFSRFWDPAEDSALVSTARHESAQMQVADKEVNESIKKNSIAMVAANYADDKALQTHLDAGLATIAFEARKENWTNEQMTLARREFISRAISGAAALATTNGFSNRSLELLTKFEKDLDPNLLGELTQQAKKKKVEEVAQQQADLMAPFGTDPAKEGEVLEKLNKKYESKELSLEEYAAAEKAVQNRFIDLSRIKEKQAKVEYSQGLEAIRSAGGYSAGERLARSAKDPEVVDNLLRFNQIWYKDEYEKIEASKAISRSIAASQAGRRAQESIEDRESLDLQTKYEAALTEVGGDASKVQALIGSKYKGAEEEKLRRYAHNRDILTPPATRIAPITPFKAGAAGQEAMSKTMAWFDRETNAGRKPTASDASFYLTKVAGDRAQQILTRADAEFLNQYVAQNGSEGFVSQERVADALISVAGMDKKLTADDAMKQYPGIYKAVRARLGTVGKNVTTDQLKPIISELLVEYNKTAPMIFGYGKELENIAARKKLEDLEASVAESAFGTPTAEHIDFLRRLTKSGLDIGSEPVSSIKAGFLADQNKKKQGAKK